MQRDLTAHTDGSLPPALAIDGADTNARRGVRQAELTPVAWAVGGELAYKDWVRHGSRLGVAGRSAGWWIGDWLRYGAARYGSKYALAARVTGYDHQTLMNMVYVATRFQISRRRENLSWSHHAELAPLDLEEQDRWLERATAQRLTVRDLRHEVCSAKRLIGAAQHKGASPIEKACVPAQGRAPDVTLSRDLDADLSRNGEAGRAVTCPQCGHQFFEPALSPAREQLRSKASAGLNDADISEGGRI